MSNFISIFLFNLTNFKIIFNLTNFCTENSKFEFHEKFRDFFYFLYISDFVVTFTDHCLTMLENSSRENVRQEADVMEESLNDEELAADAAITETFQKMVSRLSMKSFNMILEKLKRYAESHILEPAVAGSIFASMVKGAAAVQPDQTLDFFVPHLCSR